jgi:hypothetical protein
MNKRHTVKRPIGGSPVDQRPTSDTQAERWQRIAVKAYELYERRGRPDGHDVEDWLEAEAIIDGRTNETQA